MIRVVLYLWLMLSSVFFLQVFPAGAQNVRQTLSGRVTDAFDEPLAGANVFVKGDIHNGTSTDVEGRFVLQLPYGRKNIVIEASFIGMKPYSIDYEGQKELIIIMEEDSNMMEGAVVTGKQNINDLDIRAKAGVINMVDINRLHDKPVVDMSLSLQGSAPGLIVTNRGDLGTKPEIRIRGNTSFRKGDTANEPLYVLDGQVISSDAFMTLNPLDIADIKILKDAVACALYGTKAANGVLEITSVRGSSGRAMVTYDFNGGITFRGRRGVHMMETDEKLEAQALKDATMAWSIAQNFERRFLHFNGNFHSDSDGGIIPYLNIYLPGKRIATVCCVRQEDIDRLDKENRGRADFIICVPESMTMTF